MSRPERKYTAREIDQWINKWLLATSLALLVLNKLIDDIHTRNWFGVAVFVAYPLLARTVPGLVGWMLRGLTAAGMVYLVVLLTSFT